MQQNLEVRASAQFMWNGFDVAIFSRASDGQLSLATNITFEPIEFGSEIKPTIPASMGGKEFLQSALDTAWECGLRPAGFNDVKEQVKAIGSHLEDMRAIAFHKIGALKP